MLLGQIVESSIQEALEDLMIRSLAVVVQNKVEHCRQYLNRRSLGAMGFKQSEPRKPQVNHVHETSRCQPLISHPRRAYPDSVRVLQDLALNIDEDCKTLVTGGVDQRSPTVWGLEQGKSVSYMVWHRPFVIRTKALSRLESFFLTPRHFKSRLNR